MTAISFDFPPPDPTWRATQRIADERITAACIISTILRRESHTSFACERSPHNEIGYDKLTWWTRYVVIFCSQQPPACVCVSFSFAKLHFIFYDAKVTWSNLFHFTIYRFRYSRYAKHIFSFIYLYFLQIIFLFFGRIFLSLPNVIFLLAIRNTWETETEKERKRLT